MASPAAPSSEPSRKRPRLASSTGSPSFTPSVNRSSVGRSMSADRALSAFDHGSSPTQQQRNFPVDQAAKLASPSKQDQSKCSTPTKPVTINIRTPHPQAHGEDASDMLEDRRDSHMSEIALLSPSKEDIDVNSCTVERFKLPNGNHTLTRNSLTPSPLSSPQIEIEIPQSDDADDDDDDGDTGSAVVEILFEDSDDDVKSFLKRFPYKPAHGTCMQGAKVYFDHLDLDKIDLNAVGRLVEWLDSLHESFKSRRDDWFDLYYFSSNLWDIIGRIFHKLFCRRNDFGGKHHHDFVQDLMLRVFRSYTLLIDRLLLVDIFLLEQTQAGEITQEFSLASRHLRALNTLLSVKKSIIHGVLVPDYLIDASKLFSAIVITFAQQDGMRHLAQYIQLVVRDVPHDVNLGNKITPHLQATASLASLTYFCESSEIRSFPQSLQEIFNHVDGQMRRFLDKQQDPFPAEKRKEIVEYLSKIIIVAAKLDESLAEQLFEQTIGRPNPALQSHYGDLIAVVWKIKLMKEYLCKGRMELRIQGIDTMNAELVQFFTSNRSPSSNEPRSVTVAPVLGFLADILLEEKIAEYIVGVESHPQLISRANNVIGFLVVTNKFTEQQAALVWKTIVSSPDPRVVTASFSMLREIISQLTRFKEELYFCKQILANPLPAMSQEAIVFLQHFVGVTRQHYENCEGEEASNLLSPQLCIYLMRELSPTRPEVSQSGPSIYVEACNALAHLAPQMSFEERRTLYKSCLEMIQQTSVDAAASVHAIQNIAKNCWSDHTFLAQELQILSALIDEFCVLAERKKSLGSAASDSRLLEELSPRIDAFLEFVLLDQTVMQGDQIQRFWHHLVGKDAISFTARDIAWRRLSAFASKSRAPNVFLDRCDADFLASNTPDHFTPGFFLFVQSMIRHKMQTGSFAAAQSNGQQIPGIDLLWRVVLTAYPGTGEDSAMEFLASIYLDKAWIERMSTESIELTHASLADSCLDRLKSAHARLRLPATPDTTSDADVMDVSASESDRPNHELVFQRTMQFLTIFLLAIRKQPEFRLRTEQHEEVIMARKSIIRGDRIVVKCQLYKARADLHIPEEITAGDLETCKEFHSRCIRLASAHGLTCFRLIWSGRYINLLEKPMESLREMGLSKAVLIMREPIQHDSLSTPVSPLDQVRTAFEEQIVKRLDELYALMDSDDLLSSLTFEFLNSFPPYFSIKEMMQNSSVNPTDAFPLDETYKVYYSVRCLREMLQEQVKMDLVDTKFISHGIGMLASLLTSRIFISNQALSDNQLGLATKIVNCFSHFLKEHSGEDSSHFSSAKALMTAVFKILESAVPIPTFAQLAVDCYELLLDASILCSEAWHALLGFPNLQDLHQALLLTQPNSQLRSTIWHLMKVKIDRFSSDVIHLSKSKLAMFFWNAARKIIPQAVEQPQQSREIFELAVFLFNGNCMDLSVEAMQKCFVDWALLLKNHHHTEVIGYEDQDIFLHGLTSLVRCCLRYLICSEAVTIDSLALMSEIWVKFLFPNHQGDTTDLTQMRSLVPVVERSTRWELYALVYNLACVHKDGFTRLLELLAPIYMNDLIFRTHMVDRTSILKARCGYVGLRNLGNTCYMNSLLTQLYMNPSFRAFMLSCRPLAPGSTPSLLLETQKLFANMQNSYTKFADASEFTCTIRTLDDDAIDIREQMDVDEFSNTLFMRWEEQMPSDEAKEKFRSFYSGKTVQQIKSKECPHVSERDDTCLAIQCDVQGKSNLYESLQSFVEGDVMEGDNKYRCEPCGKLVDAVKRTCLKEIPDHLILQLKRFEFDLGSLRRNKINDLFEFPMSIDMSKYTLSHLAESNQLIQPDMFDLMGVVVHKGQADHGHYISYIRVRPNSSNGPQWLQFDDSDVTEFHPKDIPEFCYGGFSNGKDGNTLSFLQSPKSFNGYMLFYQRTSTIETRTWNVPENTENAQQVPVPAELEHDIASENARLLDTYNVFSISHQNFIQEIKNKLINMDHADSSHQLQRGMIGLVWNHMANVTCRIKDDYEFEEMVRSLQNLCRDCHRCCYLMLGWIANHQIELRNFLLKSTQPRYRACMRSFIFEGLQELRTSVEMYGLDVSLTLPDMGEDGILPSMITTMAILAQDDLHHNPRAWDDFWGLLAEIAQCGPQECWTMIQQGLLTTCLELFMIPSEPTIQLKYSRVAELFRRRIPPHNHLIEVIALLLEHVDLHHEPSLVDVRRFDYYDDSTSLVPLTRYEQEIITGWNTEDHNLTWISSVFDRWDSSREGPGSSDFFPGDIVRHFCSGPMTLIHHLYKTFTTNIKTAESGAAEPYIRAACQFCRFCPSRETVRAMVTFMIAISCSANPTADNEGYNGYWCTAFFGALYNISLQNSNEQINDPAFFFQLLIKDVAVWAPILLTFERNHAVSQDTYKLLRRSLFKARTEDIESDVEKMCSVAIRSLFRGCAQRAAYLLSSPSSRSAMTSILCTMKDCRDYLSVLMLSENAQLRALSDIADVDLLDQFEVYRNTFDVLPDHEQDDAASSEFPDPDWAGMDLADDVLGEASDLTEVSEGELSR